MFKSIEDWFILLLVAIVVVMFSASTGTVIFKEMCLKPIDAQITAEQDESVKKALTEKRKSLIIFPYSMFLK